MKRCPTCGQTKPLDEFHRNRTKKDGRQNECIPCTRFYNGRLLSYNRNIRGLNRRTYEDVLAHRDPKTDESYVKVIRNLRLWIKHGILTWVQAEAIYLHAVERFTFAEIAEFVGCHRSAPRMAYLAGVKKLQRLYMDKADEVYGWHGVSA